MFSLSQLPPISNSSSRKRVGRGYGSGRGGHTSTRGAKGQKARNKVKSYFEGGQLPFVKRLPHISGFKRHRHPNFVLSLDRLKGIKEGQEVTPATLIDLVGVRRHFKILSSGELTHKLILRGVSVSKTAKKKIEAAGGSVA